MYSNDDNKSGPPSKHFFLTKGPPNRSLIPPKLISARAVNTSSILLEWEVCTVILFKSTYLKCMIFILVPEFCTSTSSRVLCLLSSY